MKYASVVAGWCVAGVAGAAFGQCGWQSLGSGSANGVNNAVYAVAEWDPDGAGPLARRVIVGGSFPAAGGNSAIKQIAAWDGAGWSGFGSGMFSPGSTAAVYAMVVMNDGSLVAGGDFVNANGGAVNHIAKWTGTTWQSLGGGMDSPVRAMVVMPSGLLIAAGEFTTAGGVPCSRVAKWDGASWTPLNRTSGSGGVQGTAYSLLALSGGGVMVGGEFHFADGVHTDGVAQWFPIDGWSAAGQSVAGSPGLFGTVLALINGPGGHIYAGGGFAQVNGGPADNLAVLDGGIWRPIAGGMNESVSTLTIASDGGLVAGGQFTVAGGGMSGVGGVAAPHIAVWRGGAWTPMANSGGGSGGMYLGASTSGSTVAALRVLADGSLLAGGFFNTAGGAPGAGTAANFVAQWVCSGPVCGTSDFDGDGDYGTDFDIQAFFACLGGNCCAACFAGGSDFNGDGDYGTDADIQSFFRVLGGGGC